MSTRACLALLGDTSKAQGAIPSFTDTSNLLLMAAVARLPPGHGWKDWIESVRAR